MIFPIQFCTSVFLVFIPFIILYKTSRFQARIKFFVSLNRPDNEVIDKTSGYRNSQNENGNTGKFFIGIFQRIKKCSSPKIKIWFAPMFFSGLFCGFERCGSAIILMQFPTWCSILKLVRTHFAAAGGENPPRKIRKAAEPHR